MSSSGQALRQEMEESILFYQLTQYRYTTACIEYPSVLRPEEAQLFRDIWEHLMRQYQELDLQFARRIASCTRNEQFLFTQTRWAVQMKEAQSLSRKLNFQPIPKTNQMVLRDQLQLAVGEYIQSPNSGRYYLNLGEAAQTLQGFIYFAVEFNESFIDRALSYNGKPPFSSLIAITAANPRLAVKYYHKTSCDKGVTLCGKKTKERATIEMKLTESIYHKSLKMPVINQALYSWLPAPHKNVIRCYEFWETAEHDAYYMVMEYANCGELLAVVSDLHETVNQQKLNIIDQIKAIPDMQERLVNAESYRKVLSLSPEGHNPCIEVIRFVFQQMVQAVATLHNQGVAHLDISLENFVVHFDDDGQLLVKIIDFGRAKKMNKKQNLDSTANLWPYESFDFMVTTHPGKLRYCSAAGALFCKYKDAAPYDASQEDVFALAVCLYTMLTANMPWDMPFYIERDETNANYGYLNGAKKHKIDLRTMRDAESGLTIPPGIIDANFEDFQSAQGVMHKIHENCFLDYFSQSALELLCQMFETKMTLKELAVHPFVSTTPNIDILSDVLDKYRSFQQSQHREDQKHAREVATRLALCDSNWIALKAATMVIQDRKQSRQSTSDVTMSTSVRDASQYEGPMFRTEAPRTPQKKINSLDTITSSSVGDSGNPFEVPELPYDMEISPEPQWSPVAEYDDFGPGFVSGGWQTVNIATTVGGDTAGNVAGGFHAPGPAGGSTAGSGGGGWKTVNPSATGAGSAGAVGGGENTSGTVAGSAPGAGASGGSTSALPGVDLVDTVAKMNLGKPCIL